MDAPTLPELITKYEQLHTIVEAWGNHFQDLLAAFKAQQVDLRDVNLRLVSIENRQTERDTRVIEQKYKTDELSAKISIIEAKLNENEIQINKLQNENTKLKIHVAGLQEFNEANKEKLVNGLGGLDRTNPSEFVGRSMDFAEVISPNGKHKVVVARPTK